MKKKINILYLILMIFLLLFSSISKNHIILPLVTSLSLNTLFYNIFININITNILDKYKNKYKVYKIIFIFTILLFAVLSIISYLLGNLLPISGLNIINFISVLSTSTILLIKITSRYLEYTKYKKLGTKLFNLYLISNITILSISSMLLYKVFNYNDNTNILLLYIINILTFIITMILLYLFILRKNKNKTKEIHNYKEILKNIFNINYNIVIYSIIKNSYIYTSIIILYYTLTNKYNYSYENTSIVITNTYFYGMLLIKYISLLIKKYLMFDYTNYTKQIIKIFNYLLSICILLMIISGPIARLLFNTNNFLFDLILLLFIYTIYDYIINTSININSNKANKIILFSGLIIKLLFEIPLINTNYRIGYSLSFGSILSIILGMTTSSIIGMIYINKKLKFNILNNFNNILNVIYENIILCVILVLFTLIVKVDTNNIISSILVILFYIFITILFYIIKKIIKKRSS